MFAYPYDDEPSIDEISIRGYEKVSSCPPSDYDVIQYFCQMLAEVSEDAVNDILKVVPMTKNCTSLFADEIESIGNVLAKERDYERWVQTLAYMAYKSGIDHESTGIYYDLITTWRQ